MRRIASRLVVVGASCLSFVCADCAAPSPSRFVSSSLPASASPPAPRSAVAPSSASLPSSPDAALVLSPVCEAASSEPSALAVALSVAAGEHPVFRIDDEVMGTAGASDLITDATAEDERGALPLVRRMRDHVLELEPSRAASGAVTLRYRARSVSTNDAGAPEGLRHDGTGIGGLGQHFLLLPESDRAYRIRVAWASSQCSAATRGEGMSSFGQSAPSEIVGDLGRLRAAAYFWGHPRQAKFDDGSLHLRVAWFGAPAFDVAAAGEWAERVFAAERRFFNDDDPTPYSVFVRVLQSHGDRANGVGQETSYLSWIGPRTAFARKLKVNIAHEMLHHWLGLRLRLRAPEGTAYWFTEGFTVHYSNVIAFRAGLLSADEFLESLNDLATRHFDNKRAGATNEEIGRDFFRDPELSVVPYTRGALYAAELDASLRGASHGKRTLDDALRELYRQSRVEDNREGLPADAVRALVQTELGPAGVERYEAVIVRGDNPRPPPTAYGPCFTRKSRAPKGFTWVRVPGIPEAQCRSW